MMRLFGTLSIFIGIAHGVIGQMILSGLRKEFEEFYNDHHIKIMMVTLLLVLSNCVTGLDLYFYNHPEY